MRLAADPSALLDAYVTARPFPHVVIDDLFPRERSKTVLAVSFSHDTNGRPAHEGTAARARLVRGTHA
jgi:hypothetical protein